MVAYGVIMADEVSAPTLAGVLDRAFRDAPDRAFVRDAQLRAADIEPFLRRTRRLKLAAIRR